MVGQQATGKSRRPLRAVARWKERIVWGGTFREKLLIWLLRRHYESSFRRLWQLNQTRPHFTHHRLAWFLFGFGSRAMHPYQLGRAFYTAEVLQPEDIVLDIGSGDGFLTKHFLSAQCAQLDAIDIDPAAIREAKRNNTKVNIAYYLRDAVKEPFPRTTYDVIVWNGAIGHFAPADARIVLQKIATALSPNGIFAGSESLGREGRDHLQFFETTKELTEFFRPHFAETWAKTLHYPVYNTTFVRREAYWRCSNSTARLTKLNWLNVAAD
jgi:2-polyprenyl-3-methyl-5-hydroxy-6-metoxy-1,4-benzoquinol methylase